MKHRIPGGIKFILVVCLGTIAAQAFYILRLKQQQTPANPFELRVSENAPYAREIKAILKDLRYSGLPALLRKDVRLGIDGHTKTWTLINYFQFDEVGQIIPEAGHYGLCNSLSAYVFQKLQPVIDPERYQLSSARVMESSYFPPPYANHMVLLLEDLQAKESGGEGRYVIDPSFKRYGHFHEFRDYQVKSGSELPALIEIPTANLVSDANTSTPLDVRKTVLISLALQEVEEKFRPNAFKMLLVAKRRYDFIPEALLTITKTGYEITVKENPALVRELLPPTEYTALKKHLIRLANTAEAHRNIDVSEAQ